MAFDLTGLNKEQRAAVCAPEGPVLVIAGAGSGKTKVLVHRAAYLMEEKGLSPYHLLAVTFTNKAAAEMKERLSDLTGLNLRPMWIGTFHSICARILRRESEQAGFDHNFVIYDSADSKSVIKKLVEAAGLDEKKYTPAAVAAEISKAKNRMLGPREYAVEAANPWQEDIAVLYAAYVHALRQNNALDFDDLLFETVKLLESDSALLDKYQERFQHIMVDEYQDTNHCQYRLIRLLAAKHHHIFVVGDPDQSIYGWRGADIRNILDFEADYPDCLTIKLLQNYRSTQNILDASNALIAHNRDRKEKDLFTEAGPGEKIFFYTAENDKGEARFVIETIGQLIQQGYSYKDCAVLYRTHAQSRLFEEECIRYAIPYRIYGGQRFYDRKEIKDSLAYLRLVANPADGESLGRVYNEPKRGIGKTSWERLTAYAVQMDQSLYGALREAKQIESLGPAAQEKLYGLFQMIDGWQDFSLENTSIAALMDNIWNESGYIQALQTQTDGAERLENLEQFYNLCADFDALYAEQEEPEDDPLIAFLAQISLATDLDEMSVTENYLTLMTLHAAKGLEFPVVFMAGMEEGLFPHSRMQQNIFGKNMGDGLEEERRLCYVGMTRAKERLFLSAAERRLVWGSYSYNLPSSFLEEIPPALLQCEGQRAVENIRYQRDPVAKKRRTNVFAQEGPVLTPKAQSEPNLVSLGDKVEHAKFGVGVVIAMAGEGETLQVSVAFPAQGIKQLAWRYAPIKKL